jgi:hypothetical protein
MARLRLTRDQLAKIAKNDPEATKQLEKLIDEVNNVSSITGGGGGVAISAGTQLATSGSVILSNANGITFGMAGSATVTASHNGLTSQSNQQITAFATGNTTQSSTGTFNASSIVVRGGGGASVGVSNGSVVISAGLGVSAGTQADTINRVSFRDVNGVSFGLDTAASQITASHNGLTSQSNQALSAANGSFTFQTATFANSNGISFSTGTQGIFASHNAITSQSNQALNAHAVSNTTQSSSGTLNATALSFAGAGVASVGVSNGSVVISVPSGGGGLTNINLSAGTTSNNLSAVTFANSNGITFGLNASTITASHNGLTSQSNQAVSAANGSSTFQTLSLANSNGVSFSTGTQGVFASVATSLTAINLSAGTTSNNLSAVTFGNANGITFGLNASTVTASHNGLTSQSNQAISAANGSFTFQTATFANSNGISFSTGTQGIFASHNGITSQSEQTQNIIRAVVVQGSAGAGSTQTSGTLAFENANGFSWHMETNNSVRLYATLSTNMVLAGNTAGESLYSGTQLRIAGGANITVSGGSAASRVTIIGAAGGVSFSAGTTSNVLTNVTFSNSNGVSFGLNGSTITASHNGITSQSIQALNAHAVSNTTQSSSGTLNATALSFAGAGVASVGVSNGSVVISVPSGGGGLTNVNISAGTTSQNLSNLVFSNSNGVSFGLNGSTVTASVNAAGGGATVSMFPDMPWPWASSSMYTGASTTVAGGSSSTLSWYVAPLVIGQGVTFNDVKAIVSVAATAAGTGSGSHRHVIGIYSRNASTLSLVTSFAWNAAHSQNSVTAQTLTWWPGAWSASTTNSSSINGNVSATIQGLHEIRLNATSSATSLSAGEYFIAHAYNFRSSSAALFGMGSAWRYSVSQFTGAFGFSNTSGPIQGMPWNGIVSTVSTTPTQFEWVAPASIHSSVITGTGGTSQNQWPLVILQSATA